jgi:hypothetical protein
MVIENLVFFSASNLTNSGGGQAIQPQDTDGILAGTGPFTVGSGGPIPVQIDDTDSGDNSGLGDDTTADFDDGTGVNQVLAAPVELSYFNGTSTVSTIFPAGTQVQSESIVNFSSGFSILILRFENPSGTPPLINAGYAIFDPDGNPVVPDPGTSLGTVVSTNGDGTTPYVNIACFVAGTLIETPAGEVPVEALDVGALVMTADREAQPLVWKGQVTVLPSDPGLWPIVIPAGVLGNPLPLAVSPQHRVLLRHPAAELMFGASEVLVPAQALVGFAGVTRRRARRPVTYVHLACQDHMLVRSNGAWSETLLAGEAMLGGAAAPEAEGRRAARPVLKGFEARLLAESIFGREDAATAARGAA